MYFLCCLKSPGDYMRQAFIQGGLLFKEIRYMDVKDDSMHVKITHHVLLDNVVSWLPESGHFQSKTLSEANICCYCMHK